VVAGALVLSARLAVAATINLDSGGSGSFTPGQTYNETRAADVTVLSPLNLQVTSMTLSGINGSGLAKAVIYDANTQSLLASAQGTLSGGTITLAISATLLSGNEYRIGFYGQLTSGTVFQPSSFPYVESSGLLRINSAWESVTDGFPANSNLEVPEVSLQVTQAQPAPGFLDPTFAGSGLSRIGFGGGQAFAHAAAVQSDSKLVMGGSSLNPASNRSQFALARFDTNNVLDTAFGNGGKALIRVSLSTAYTIPETAYAVAIQTDGKIVAGGTAYDGTNSSFALVRLDPDGSLDLSFGSNGMVLTDLGFTCAINALAVQPDGKIVAVGFAGLGGPADFLLARYQADGVLDPTFGAGGIVETPMNGACYALFLQVDGSIVAAGYGSFPEKLALARYTTNGVLDTTFGGTGEVFTTVPGAGYATAIGFQYGITVQNPPKLVVAGPANGQFVIARYLLSNGSLDTSFGNGGVVTDSFGPGWSEGLAVVVTGGVTPFQPVKITVGGYVGTLSHPGTNYFALARYTGSGAADTTFGGGAGKTTIAVRPGHDDEGTALTFQSGKLVLAGLSQSLDGANSDFAAARFNSDGSLDTSFGSGGVVLADITDLGSQALGVQVQPDGKIVVAGSASNSVQTVFALARFNPNGVLDETFGTSGGRVTTVVGSGNATADAVSIQTDGKIVAAGYSFNGADYDFAVARYNSDGSPDTAFGSAGQVVTPIGSGNDFGRAVAIQADKKIVLAGYSYNGAYYDFAVVRYATNGALDTTFGGTGRVTTSIAGAGAQAWAVSVQADKKIVAAGQAQVGTNLDFALVRYNADGTLDNSFGSLGRVVTGFGGGVAAFGLAMAIQPDGRILVAGGGNSNGVDYVALARYATNGVLDTTFGAAGWVVTQTGLVYDYAASLAVKSDGKIIVAGASQQGANYDYAVLRYTPNGSLDTSYGVGGKVLVSFGDGGNDLGNAVALDQIGRAVVAGGANNLFGVARLTSEAFLKITSINPATNGSVMLQGLGVPAAIHTLRASPDLTPGSFSPWSSVTTDAGGFWQYQDTNTAGVSRRSYRLSFP
jgi:uncharacterized delta-60 repeat protein